MKFLQISREILLLDVQCLGPLYLLMDRVFGRRKLYQILVLYGCLHFRVQVNWLNELNNHSGERAWFAGKIMLGWVKVKRLHTFELLR